MAVRERKGRPKPHQVYWNNPHTGKRESRSFATKEEALKEDSMINHKLKFDRESFVNKEEDNQKATNLEQAYLAYLVEKQFNKKALTTQMDSMRPILREIGYKNIKEIGREDLLSALELHSKRNVKQVTISGRMRVFYTFLRWCEKKDLLKPFNYPSKRGAMKNLFRPVLKKSRECSYLHHLIFNVF